MQRIRRAALVSALANKMHDHDSWVGETHLQKGVYLLQDMLGVPMDVEYVLFKHGPFSFQLREELGAMRADDILKIVPQRPPYGPRLYSDDGAKRLQEKFPKTLIKYEPQLDWIADHLGDKGVVELEKLATAFWVTEELGRASEVGERADLLQQYKPHFDDRVCVEAVTEIDAMLKVAPAIVAPST